MLTIIPRTTRKKLTKKKSKRDEKFKRYNTKNPYNTTQGNSGETKEQNTEETNKTKYGRGNTCILQMITEYFFIGRIYKKMYKYR